MLRHYFIARHNAMPDTEAELARLHGTLDAAARTDTARPARRRTIVMRAIGAVAAAAALLLLVAMHTAKPEPQQQEDGGTMLFEANTDAPTDITMSTDGGTPVAIDTERPTVAAAETVAGREAVEPAGLEDERYEHRQITIPRGKSYRLTLADGTEVWLNADSKLTYPGRFKGKYREVALEGEAYFSVAKDKAHPFIVHTPQMTTTVTGTEFNVSAYSGAPTHVTLVKGRVSVARPGHNATQTLSPGDDAATDGQADIQVRQVDTDSHTLWKEGLFYFDNVPLETVLKEIGRWYNVSVRIEDMNALRTPVRYISNRAGTLTEAIGLLNSLGKVKVTQRENTLLVKKL